jgi:hypothetical protein
MERWRRVVAAVLVLALPLAGCQRPFDSARDLLPVGTCVQVSDQGEVVVPCAEPHTHKVIAIAPRAEECPGETTIYASPADPHDGTVTACYVRDGE